MRPISDIGDIARFYDGFPRSTEEAGPLFEKLLTAIYSCPNVLPKDGWAVDGGANRGMHTFPLARLCDRVIGFEPHRYIFKLLVAEVLKSSLKNITILEQALSDEVGTQEFYIINAPGGFALEVHPDLKDHETLVTTVLVTSLDSAFAPPRLDFIKLDLEGHEFAALRGGLGLLQKHRPVVAMECYKEQDGQRYGYSADEFFGFWEKLDYKVYDICGLPFSRDTWSWDVWTPWYLMALPAAVDTAPILKSINTTLRDVGHAPRF